MAMVWVSVSDARSGVTDNSAPLPSAKTAKHGHGPLTAIELHENRRLMESKSNVNGMLC